MVLKPRRVGSFALSVTMLHTHGDTFRRIMGRCIILRAEHRLDDNRIHYDALCAEFDEISEGEITPFYTWRLKKGVLSAQRKT